MWGNDKVQILLSINASIIFNTGKMQFDRNSNHPEPPTAKVFVCFKRQKVINMDIQKLIKCDF